MPAYDYRCQHCDAQFTLTYPSIAAYSAAKPSCPKCASTDLSRIIKRVGIMRSEESRIDNLEGMAGLDALDDLENADPQTLGRMMRQMSNEVGEDMGPELNEVVDRLEAGESPEAIESSMGDTLDSLDDGAGDFDLPA